MQDLITEGRVSDFFERGNVSFGSIRLCKSWKDPFVHSLLTSSELEGFAREYRKFSYASGCEIWRSKAV